MLRHADYTRNRIRQFADRLRKKIYPAIVPLAEISVSGPHDRITRAAAQELGDFRPAKLGDQLGPKWATFWFRLKAAVPAEWKGRRVDLRWATHSEGTLWIDGVSTQGLNPQGGRNPWNPRDTAVLLEKAAGGETVEFQVETACNDLFGHDHKPFETLSAYVLDRAEIGLYDPDAWTLYHDFYILAELEAESTRKGERGDLDQAFAGELLAGLNEFCNVVDADDKSTWPAGEKILKGLYQNHNATTVHELSAIGHAHIDTAWLWPLAETWRKCDRSFSSATTYMDRYPEFKFSCSQAYQYEVVKERNPALYEKIERYERKGQWVPVGGTWIEPDCNLPSGESLIRQFLYGQRFFEKAFGKRCGEFWNPDVFGYNGQLPQIMQLCGATRFLTQKLSWNKFTQPMHHTFDWEGLDGTKVLAHFPPADTYNADASVKLLRDNARHYKDHDRGKHSLMLYGWGDGGGGPTPHMIETLLRCKDLEGVPRVTLRSSDEFFTLLEKDVTDRPKMVGELYFELHRGTYTTQAQVKRDNRRAEDLLHDVEFLSAVAARKGGFAYPQAQIDKLWKVVLLNQFHDILPGSSITLVYEDTHRQMAEVLAEGETLRAAALGSGNSPVNTLDFARAEVATGPGGKPVYVETPAYGVGKIAESSDAVTLTEQGDHLILKNKRLTAKLTKGGRLVSLVDAATGREAVDGEANVLEMYDDKPNNWDAWDIDPFHLETGRPVPPATSHKVLATNTPLRAEASFEYVLSHRSKLTMTARLDAASERLEFHCHCDWREDEMCLKVAHAVNVRSMTATYEMQFGIAERPTHFNMPADVARFEVPGHRWADLSEFGYGVSLLSESKYGFSTLANVMHMTLLRAPMSPDPTADRGEHRFAWALYPHAGGWAESDVVRQGAAFNRPILFGGGSAGGTIGESAFESTDRNLVLDTVKKAEESDATVLRFYECHGGRGTATVKIGLPFAKAVYTNGLEDEGEAAEFGGGVLTLPYTPYQVITVKLT